ncbi:MAG: MarR family transcriptional regulator [Brevundimonas sp.]|jgi:DNA-binding MarR family transcriptional regulator|uniref:MarR family winged helix-turn-helix transcriptional regulator n=1 Tax=Brevundimonas sp. TaxID=1871086 RepID=UPI0017A1535E|nr:MarR family transcriptional regulator [Brevundimonas sp.]MBA4803399.1 MarR family transcriptional regulator [Brevundimonas sp.]
MSDFSPDAAPDPTAALVRSVRRIAQAIDVRSREMARLTGLTLPQLLVLQSIRALGEVSTHAVSRDVSMSAPTVVAVLDRLEARGLIVRYRSTSDRRIVHARLTPEGEAAVAGAPGLLRPRAMRALAALPADQREALAAAIQTVTDLIVFDAVADEESPAAAQAG